MSWAAPKVDWATDDVIATTDMNRMEENSRILGQGGGPVIATVTAANSLDIGTVSKVFKVDGNTAIRFISTTGRDSGDVITLILTDQPDLEHRYAGPGAGYASLDNIMLVALDSISYGAINPNYSGLVVQYVYNGTYWKYIS